jgi:hypothetical protein
MVAKAYLDTVLAQATLKDPDARLAQIERSPQDHPDRMTLVFSHFHFSRITIQNWLLD